jgi:signal transduction histidine kinase
VSPRGEPGSLRRRWSRAAIVWIALQAASSTAAAWAGWRALQALRAEQEAAAARNAVAAFSSAAREAYVHQAHTLLEGTAAHLDHTREAELHAESRLLALELRSEQHPEDVARAHEAWERFVAGFRDEVAPRARRGELHREESVRLHGQTEALAGRVEESARALRTSLDAHAARDRLRTAEALRAGAWALGGLLIASLAAAVGVTRAFARATLPPLEVLTRTAALIGRGSTEARAALPPDTATELRAVGEALDAMAEARAAAEADRAAAQDRRVEAERLAALGEMSASVAHELLNPLATILAVTSDSVVRDEAGHAKRVVEGLIGFARGGRGEAAVDVDLEREAQAALDRAALFADAAEVSLRLDAPAEPPPLRAPPGAVRHVLDNLVRNAIQASPKGSEVCLRIETDALLVEDSGTGIPAALRLRLYQPFATGRVGGTGLGLAVARRIVVALGGELIHQDRPEGGTIAHWRLRG